MEMPDKFFTKESVATLGGATAMVLIISSYMASMFQTDPRFVALFVAQLVAFLGLASLPVPAGTKRWGPVSIIFAFANGALLYCSATGINTINHGLGSDTSRVQKANLLGNLDPVPWWPTPSQSQPELDKERARAQAAEAAATHLKATTEKLQSSFKTAEKSSRDIEQLTKEVQRALASQKELDDSLRAHLTMMQQKANELTAILQKTVGAREISQLKDLAKANQAAITELQQTMSRLEAARKEASEKTARMEHQLNLNLAWFQSAASG